MFVYSRKPPVSTSSKLFAHSGRVHRLAKTKRMLPGTKAVRLKKVADIAIGHQPVDDASEKAAFYKEVSSHLLSPTLSFRAEDKEIASLFVPAMGAQLLEPLQSFVESIFVARLGVSELGALGAGTLLFQFAVGFFGSFLFATTPRIAMAKDNSQRSEIIASGVWAAMVVGLAFGGLLFASAPTIVSCERPPIRFKTSLLLFASLRA
jgi:hypothetical protein